MKTQSLLILTLASACLISCSKEKPVQEQQIAASEPVAASQAVVEDTSKQAFDIGTLPTIALDSSAYPFVQLPTLYEARDHKTLDYEKFYFAIHGKPTPLEGKLYRFGITTKNNETKFSDTLMLRSFQEGMQKLGAKELNNEQISYDLYDVIPDSVERNEANIGQITPTYGFKTKDGKTYIIQLSVNPPAVVVMEVKPFDFETQPVSAPATTVNESTNSKDLAKSIEDTGKATVHINFAVNDAKIEASSQSVIDEIAKLLHDNKNLKIAIQGHTDNTGTAQNNLKLSEKRAQSVRAALIEKSISADRLQAKGLGQAQPVASNESEDGKAQNRRVELIKIN